MDSRTVVYHSNHQKGEQNAAYENSAGDVEFSSTPNGTYTINGSAPKGETERDNWSNGLEFLMSCIAMSVGLGNVWRFPFTAYENGGGAFLIPYIIVLLVIGRPVYYLEMCLGQFSSRANVKTFAALAPCLQGIGYGQTFGSFCVATYYCFLMAITLFYFVNSTTNDLPWATCRAEWAHADEVCVASKSTNVMQLNASGALSSSELYFKKEVLQEIADISGGIGLPEWRMTLCLFASWAITFAVSINGVKSAGKASYFLALFPYVILIALLIRAVTLDGASTGIFYFIKPDWVKLFEAKVWYSAVTQCFYSLNIGFGSLIMYASYNDFHHNIYRDAIVVAFLDTFASVLAGTTIFGILGNLAYKQHRNVNEVINTGGTGLAFISYPEAIAKFDSVPWVFALLFFAMLFILGVGSLVALQGSSCAVIFDHFPYFKKWYISLGCATAGFLIGLIYTTPGGQFMVTLVDYYSGSFIFFILATFEVVSIFWWYGLENFCDDVEFMLNRRVGMYWRITWGIVTPSVLIAIFVYFIMNIQRLKHGSIDFPDHVLVCGWAMLVIAIFQTVIWWLYYVWHKRQLGVSKAFEKSFSHDGWGPKNHIHYKEWLQRKQELRECRNRVNIAPLQRLWCIFTAKKYY